MRDSSTEIGDARRAILDGIERVTEEADPDYANGCVALGFVLYAEVATPDGSRREMTWLTGSVGGSAGSPWQARGYVEHMTPRVKALLT